MFKFNFINTLLLLTLPIECFSNFSGMITLFLKFNKVEYNVYYFINEVTQLIDSLLQSYEEKSNTKQNIGILHPIIIVCGGTSYYMSYLIFDNMLSNPSDNADTYAANKENTWDMLNLLNSNEALKYQPNDHRRIHTAICRVKSQRDISILRLRYKSYVLCTDYMNMEEYKFNLNTRVDIMVEQGLASELVVFLSINSLV